MATISLFVCALVVGTSSAKDPRRAGDRPLSSFKRGDPLDLTKPGRISPYESISTTQNRCRAQGGNPVSSQVVRSTGCCRWSADGTCTGTQSCKGNLVKCAIGKTVTDVVSDFYECTKCAGEELPPSQGGGQLETLMQ